MTTHFAAELNSALMASFVAAKCGRIDATQRPESWSQRHGTQSQA